MNRYFSGHHVQRQEGAPPTGRPHSVRLRRARRPRRSGSHEASEGRRRQPHALRQPSARLGAVHEDLDRDGLGRRREQRAGLRFVKRPQVDFRSSISDLPTWRSPASGVRRPVVPCLTLIVSVVKHEAQDKGVRMSVPTVEERTAVASRSRQRATSRRDRCVGRHPARPALGRRFRAWRRRRRVSRRRSATPRAAPTCWRCAGRPAFSRSSPPDGWARPGSRATGTAPLLLGLLARRTGGSTDSAGDGADAHRRSRGRRRAAGPHHDHRTAARRACCGSPRRVTQHRAGTATTTSTRCALCCPSRPKRPSCSTSPVATCASAPRSGIRSSPERTSARAGAGAPAPTPASSSRPAPRASASARARSGPCTPRGAATTRRSRNSGSPAPACSAPASCCCRARSSSSRASRTRRRRCTAPTEQASTQIAAVLPRASPRPAVAPDHPAPCRAQHLGSGLLRPGPRLAHEARRTRGAGGRRAVRPRRRLVHPPPPRPRRPRRLAGRPRRVAGRPRPAGRRRARARHAVRALVRARDDQRGLGCRSRASRMDPRPRGPAADRRPLPAGAQPHDPGGVRLHPRVDELAHRRVRHRLHQVGPQPRPRRGRRPHDRRAARARSDARDLCAHGRAAPAASRARDRVVLVGRWPRRPRRARAHATGCGRATASTRSSASRSSAGPGLLLPPELVGSHVGAPTAHTTHRTHSLAFRAATALFGHFGIEWDLRAASRPRNSTSWPRGSSSTRQERELIHTGTAVHSDYPDEAYWAHGYVSPDQDRAIFSFVALGTTAGRAPRPHPDPRPPRRRRLPHRADRALGLRARRAWRADRRRGGATQHRLGKRSWPDRTAGAHAVPRAGAALPTRRR